MNNNCDKENCVYKKTCLISDREKIDKCTGILSKRNPHHENYTMQIRGNK